MKSGTVQLNVSLSHLVPSRRNPRKVKPGREAHQRLVALIRSQGLLQPLVVRCIKIKPKRYEVVAGDRRLQALREIHRGNGDPKIPCVLRDVDTVTADVMSLGENFAREQMHPLDEAEAFAKLATSDGKDAAAIATEFGVREHYVKQRMKLASLSATVKDAHREGRVDTATAEAFAAVPEDRQLEVWKELGGNPRHAEHVRNVIANAWIDAKHAKFDLSSLPPDAVSGDLFADRVLVERRVFMEAQANAVESQRQSLAEEGWSEVVIGRREDVYDRLLSMDTPEREFDEATERKLAKVASRRERLEAAVDKLDDDDQSKLNRLQARFEQLETQEQEIVASAPEHVSEATKAVATAFIILDPDGRVHRECRIPRRRHSASRGNGHSDSEHGGGSRKSAPPTSDDLSDRQLALTFTHQALAVREALLKDTATRKRVLAMILHERVHSEAIAVRHDANAVSITTAGEEFNSPIKDRMVELRSRLEPFSGTAAIEDVEAYRLLSKLAASKLDGLIDLLTVECVTAHLRRRTSLVQDLTAELEVNVRDTWRPDAVWLAGYQKFQLAHLIAELLGPIATPSPDRKKSELVTQLDKLFGDAAAGKLEDKKLADRLNQWLPANLRDEKKATREKRAANSKRE